MQGQEAGEGLRWYEGTWPAWVGWTPPWLPRQDPYTEVEVLGGQKDLACSSRSWFCVRTLMQGEGGTAKPGGDVLQAFLCLGVGLGEKPGK